MIFRTNIKDFKMSNLNYIKIWLFFFNRVSFSYKKYYFFGKLNAENTLSTQQGVW